MVVLALALAPSTHAEPGAAPQAPPDPSTRCTTCHAEIAREWDASMHHRSGTDPAYLRAVAIEPLPFCRACHVPSADPGEASPPALAAHGIGCPSCHLGLAAEHGSRAKTDKHAPVRSCDGCHEFRFPKSEGLMQRTATEHAQSAFASTTCSTCHMPKTGGPRPHVDHTFAVGEAMLRSALVADVSRAGPTRVALRLAPGRVGHAFPTGDLFRRLDVTAVARDDDGEVVASAGRMLSRTLRSVRVADGTLGKTDARDDRVGAGLEACFELDVGSRGAGRPLVVSIAYERLQEPQSRGSAPLINGAVTVWSGTVSTRETFRPCR